MSASVEHDKRKNEILDKALEVFEIEGYKDTTFQKIAERCGITRTILYLYFNNKKDIFSACIKRFLGKMESELTGIANDTEMESSEKLLQIGNIVMQICQEETHMLSVVIDYLLRLKASGGDPDERVRRRTIRMRHILAYIIIDGKKKGEFSQDVSVKAASDLFYALIEAAVFRLTVRGKKETTDLMEPLHLLVSSLCVKKC
ncbi:MAG: TetR/AcrR family transcriptional regulator [Spirochaetaceae bacterium]|nr:TetR/AcrR family transcriptional regulator [Spirochaetaceae bacterium]